MAATKEVALQEAKRILSYIESKELTDEDKERITKDSIENFNNHVNPGWLVYRKICIHRRCLH